MKSGRGGNLCSAGRTGPATGDGGGGGGGARKQFARGREACSCLSLRHVDSRGAPSKHGGAEGMSVNEPKVS